MFSQNIKGKHGLAKLTVKKGVILVKLPRTLYNDGVDRVKSLGLKNDIKSHQVKAESILTLINQDILDGQFDYSYKRYLNHHQESHSIKLIDIYKNHIELKGKQRPGTRKAYEWTIKLLEKIPYTDPLKPLPVFDWLYQHHSEDTIYRFCMQINAAMKTAIKLGMIKENPWFGFYETLNDKVKKEKNITQKKPKALTIEQQDKIIQTFQNNQYYSHYWEFVAFRFYSGLRTCEIIALEWSDFNSDFTVVKICRAYLSGENNKFYLETGLKTEHARIIPLTKKAREIIIFLADKKKNSKLVFPSPNGLYIHPGNFSKRAWKTILTSLGINPIGREDGFNPYKTRATFITDKRKKGINADDISKYVGNSPEIIREYYDATDSLDIDIKNW